MYQVEIEKIKKNKKIQIMKGRKFLWVWKNDGDIGERTPKSVKRAEQTSLYLGQASFIGKYRLDRGTPTFLLG